MDERLKEYKGIFWTDDPTRPGQRVTLYAKSGEDAIKQLKEEFGENIVVSVYNEEAANRLR